jgi:hypothetical protein
VIKKSGSVLIPHDTEDTHVSAVAVFGFNRIWLGIRDGDEELEVAMSEDDARSLLEFLKDYLGDQ